MYSFSITDQLVVFIESVGFGVLLGVTYSVVDVAASVFFEGRRKIIACDIAFCPLCAVALFSFILAYNLGKLRFYMVLGILLGLAVYFVAFGSYAQSACEFITRLVHRAFALSVRPFKRMFLKLRSKLARTEKKEKNKKKKFKNLRKSIANENESVV